MTRLKISLLAGTTVALLLLPNLAVAEEKAPAQPVASITPELTSGVSVSEIYSDNIYASRTNKISDWFTVINPFANLRLRSDKSEVNVGGNAAIGRYATYHDENYNDYSGYANGRYNFSPMLSMNGGGGYDHLHEARSSPNAPNLVQ